MELLNLKITVISNNNTTINTNNNNSGDDIRRLVLPLPVTFEQLKQRLVQLVPNHHHDLQLIQFEDDEGDKCSVTNQHEWDDAIKLGSSNGSPASPKLRLYVHYRAASLANGNNDQPNNSASSVQKAEEQEQEKKKKQSVEKLHEMIRRRLWTGVHDRDYHARWRRPFPERMPPVLKTAADSSSNSQNMRYWNLILRWRLDGWLVGDLDDCGIQQQSDLMFSFAPLPCLISTVPHEKMKMTGCC